MEQQLTHEPTRGDKKPEALATQSVSILAFRTTVNGAVRQHDNTGNMMHDWAKMIAYASTAWTLEPGDVVATGTCSGVALGLQPPRWLQVGDVVRMEVEGIGYLENRVVPEPPGTMGCIG